MPKPHSQVVSFRTDAQMDNSCEGASLNSQNAGVGKYAVSLTDIKGPEASPMAYHYALFAHYVGCDSKAHCPVNALNNTSSRADNNLAFGQSGLAEISGSDFVVALGGVINSAGLAPHFLLSSAFMHELGHNLGLRHDGHLDRVCTTSGDCASGETCADLGFGDGMACRQTVGGVLGREEPNYKPNYLSIMNYNYEKNGIEVGNSLGSRVALSCNSDSECGPAGGMCVVPPIGGHCSMSSRVCNSSSDCPVDGESCIAQAAPSMKCSKSAYACSADADCNVGESCVAPTKPGSCARLDYSRQTLPIGGLTQGYLDESNLNDGPGLGSGTTDIFRFTDAVCHFVPAPAPTTGPVNWAGSGYFFIPSGDMFRFGIESFTDTSVQADIDANGACSAAPATDILHGHTDWPDLSGVDFNYKFQCTPSGVFDKPRLRLDGAVMIEPAHQEQPASKKSAKTGDKSQ